MGKAVPNTQSRVAENTSEQINERLRREMEARVYYLAQNTDVIDARLQELDEEWDIERVLEANAAGISILGVLMARRNRKWLVVPFAVAGFLMQHAIQGWCPPIPLFRKLGVRTVKEINDERQALKVLTGDIDGIDVSNVKDAQARAEKALEASDLIST